jgi:hypothetical protein
MPRGNVSPFEVVKVYCGEGGIFSGSVGFLFVRANSKLFNINKTTEKMLEGFLCH